MALLAGMTKSASEQRYLFQAHSDPFVCVNKSHMALKPLSLVALFACIMWFWLVVGPMCIVTSQMASKALSLVALLAGMTKTMCTGTEGPFSICIASQND